jgi:CheY-like chemotaxis protein
LNVGSNNPSLDAVDLDHKMPKKDGMDVAKEILAVNPYQRIIFASAHTMEFLGYGIAVETSCRISAETI